MCLKIYWLEINSAENMKEISKRVQPGQFIFKLLTSFFLKFFNSKIFLLTVPVRCLIFYCSVPLHLSSPTIPIQRKIKCNTYQLILNYISFLPLNRVLSSKRLAKIVEWHTLSISNCSIWDREGNKQYAVPLRICTEAAH